MNRLTAIQNMSIGCKLVFRRTNFMQIPQVNEQLHRDLMSICELVSIDVTTFKELELSACLLSPRSVTTKDYLRKEATASC